MASRTQPTYNRRRAKRLAVAGIGGLPEKRPKAGHNVSHAQNKTKRLFKPNLQKTKVLLGNRLVSVRIDTRTLRTLTKKLKEQPERAATKKTAKSSSRPKASNKTA